MPRSDEITRCEDRGMTVVEGEPESPAAQAIFKSCKRTSGKCTGYSGGRCMVEIMAKETEKKKAEEAYFITTKELAEAGRDNIPEELISSKHLIYSSPATLAYNSPGAQGFGVKRAGLAIPGSVMPFVSTRLLRKKYNDF